MEKIQKLLNHNRPLIKICGNKFYEEVLKVAKYNPDFMGWIFSPYSPRKIDIEDALKQLIYLKEKSYNILTVAVFSGNSIDEIIKIVKYLNQYKCLDLIQITEESHFINNLRMNLDKNDIYIPVIPVIRPQQIITEQIFLPFEPSLFYILDRFDPEKKGGTGKQIPSEYFNKPITKPYLIAGGINPNNVIEILTYSKAKGIDLSSGIEDQPGIKNEKKLEELFLKVRNFKIPDDEYP